MLAVVAVIVAAVIAARGALVLYHDTCISMM